MKARSVERVSQSGRFAILTVVSAVLFAPFVFMVSIALSSDARSLASDFTFFPSDWEFSNFTRIFDSTIPIWLFFLNSIAISLLSCIGMVTSSALAAFAFARLRAPGKNGLFLVLLATMMIPAEVILIPQFVLFRNLGWINTWLPLIVPMFFAGAYNVFLMRQFISRIPQQLDEAAMIDGVGLLGIFGRIILPLMRPVLVAVGVFTFTFAWGNFMGPLIYLNSMEKFPLALGIQIISATTTDAQPPPWNMVMVGAVMLIMPMLIVYYLGQRYIYEIGITGGSAGLR